MRKYGVRGTGINRRGLSVQLRDDGFSLCNYVVGTVPSLGTVEALTWRPLRIKLANPEMGIGRAQRRADPSSQAASKTPSIPKDRGCEFSAETSMLVVALCQSTEPRQRQRLSGSRRKQALCPYEVEIWRDRKQTDETLAEQKLLKTLARAPWSTTLADAPAHFQGRHQDSIPISQIRPSPPNAKNTAEISFHSRLCLVRLYDKT